MSFFVEKLEVLTTFVESVEKGFKLSYYHVSKAGFG